MKGKIIIIGESWLEISFKENQPDSAHPGGVLLRTAGKLAKEGHNVIFLSEIGKDKPGEIVAGCLAEAGVDISNSDRHMQQTPVVLNFGTTASRYMTTDDGEGFDIIWPRVEEDDIIVFGGFFAVDQRIRAQFTSFMSYVSERGCEIIYVPDLADGRISRITKVMPAVYENLEMATRVITLPSDLTALFNHNDAERARKENFGYYVNDYRHLTDESGLPAAIMK